MFIAKEERREKREERREKREERREKREERREKREERREKREERRKDIIPEFVLPHLSIFVPIHCHYLYSKHSYYTVVVVVEEAINLLLVKWLA